MNSSMRVPLTDLISQRAFSLTPFRRFVGKAILHDEYSISSLASFPISQLEEPRHQLSLSPLYLLIIFLYLLTTY